jgi:hypothetical protein
VIIFGVLCFICCIQAPLNTKEFLTVIDQEWEVQPETPVHFQVSNQQKNENFPLSRLRHGQFPGAKNRKNTTALLRQYFSQKNSFFVLKRRFWF